ncbi:MAG: OmpA family protein, partial [Flavobacteriales bacterium]
KKGIDQKRLDYKGYGEEQPIAKNNTEKGRQKNRRTEFEIIKDKEQKKSEKGDESDKKKEKSNKK